MLLSDLLIPVLVALVIGFVLGYFYVKGQITAIEERCRANLERWKIEAGNEIRKDSVNLSRSTLKGKIAEQMAPVLLEFAFNLVDARFIGSPWITSSSTGSPRLRTNKKLPSASCSWM